MTVSQALTRFVEDYIWQHGYAKSTSDNYRWSLTSFTKACGDIPIAQITQDHIKSWRQHMERNNYTVGAINAFLYRMRKFLKYYSTSLELQINPDEIVIPKKDKPIPKYLTRGEINQLIDAGDLREKAIVSLLYASGIRVGELVKLRRSDIQGDFIKVRGKGRIERVAFLDAKAQKHLQAYLKVCPKCQFLFPSKKGGGLHVQQIQIIVRHLGEQALNKQITPHMLRHSFATHMVQNGCGAFHLQKMLGHADISTTQIYVHLGSADLKSAYNKFHS